MNGLTEKEVTILQSLADGEPKKVIAGNVGMKYSSFKNLLCAVREKLDASTTENAVATGIRRGLID